MCASVASIIVEYCDCENGYHDEELEAACSLGDEKTVSHLLFKGATPYCNKGRPILLATKHGHGETLRALLCFHPSQHRCKDEALFLACENNQWDMAHILLECGADANANEGRAVLLALDAGNPQLLALLFSFGARIPEIRRSLKTEKKEDEVPCISEKTLPVMIGKARNIAILEIFVHHGLDLDLCGADIMTSAVMTENKDVIRALWDCPRGQDAFLRASVVKAIFENRVFSDDRDADHLTGLGLSVLVEKMGAIIEMEGTLFLRLAAEYGSLDALKYIWHHLGYDNRRSGDDKVRSYEIMRIVILETRHLSIFEWGLDEFPERQGNLLLNAIPVLTRQADSSFYEFIINRLEENVVLLKNQNTSIFNILRFLLAFASSSNLHEFTRRLLMAMDKLVLETPSIRDVLEEHMIQICKFGNEETLGMVFAFLEERQLVLSFRYMERYMHLILLFYSPERPETQDQTRRLIRKFLDHRASHDHVLSVLGYWEPPCGFFIWIQECMNRGIGTFLNCSPNERLCLAVQNDFLDLVQAHFRADTAETDVRISDRLFVSLDIAVQENHVAVVKEILTRFSVLPKQMTCLLEHAIEKKKKGMLSMLTDISLTTGALGTLSVDVDILFLPLALVLVQKQIPISLIIPDHKRNDRDSVLNYVFDGLSLEEEVCVWEALVAGNIRFVGISEMDVFAFRFRGAVLKQNFKVVKMLSTRFSAHLSKGCLIMSLIEEATLQGRLAILKRLSSEASYLSYLEGRFYTILSYVASRGHLEIVDYLLESSNKKHSFRMLGPSFQSCLLKSDYPVFERLRKYMFDDASATMKKQSLPWLLYRTWRKNRKGPFGDFHRYAAECIEIRNQSRSAEFSRWMAAGHESPSFVRHLLDHSCGSTVAYPSLCTVSKRFFLSGIHGECIEQHVTYCMSLFKTRFEMFEQYGGSLFWLQQFAIFLDTFSNVEAASFVCNQYSAFLINVMELVLERRKSIPVGILKTICKYLSQEDVGIYIPRKIVECFALQDWHAVYRVLSVLATHVYTKHEDVPDGKTTCAALQILEHVTIRECFLVHYFFSNNIDE